MIRLITTLLCSIFLLDLHASSGLEVKGQYETYVFYDRHTILEAKEIYRAQKNSDDGPMAESEIRYRLKYDDGTGGSLIVLGGSELWNYFYLDPSDEITFFQTEWTTKCSGHLFLSFTISRDGALPEGEYSGWYKPLKQ